MRYNYQLEAWDTGVILSEERRPDDVIFLRSGSERLHAHLGLGADLAKVPLFQISHEEIITSRAPHFGVKPSWA